MEKQKSIKKNFAMNMILSLSSVIFPFITFPYSMNVLSTDGYGKVAFVTSIVSYFSMIAQLGIPTYGIRACSKVRDDKEKLSKVVQELLIISGIMTLVSGVALFFSVLFIPRLQGEKLLFLIISSTLLFNAIGMEWLYKALEEYSYITIRSVVFKFIALIALFLLVTSEEDYILYGGITIFAASASNVMNFVHARKIVSFKRFAKYDLKQHIKPVIIFFAMSCAITIYTNMDNAMLGFMTSDTDVAYYHAAVRIKTILVSVITSLGTVILPRASYYVKQGMMEEFERVSRKALNFVLVAAASMMLYFMIFSKEAIVFLSKSKYLSSVPSMQIIMPTLLFIGITNILGIQIMIPLGKEKYVLYSEIAGAIVDLLINLLLIPSMKSAGAAIGTVVAEAVVLLVQMWFLRKDVPKLFRNISYWKILLGLILAAVASVWVKVLPLGLSRIDCFIKLSVSALLFFGAYGAFLLITGEQMAKEILDSVMGKVLKKIKHS